MTLSEQELLCGAMLLFLQRQTTGVPGGMPSGHLYAQLMSVMSLNEYNECLEYLKTIGAVVESPSHLLTLVT